jgi:TolB-like protein/class 3 adenylate cyclase
MSDDAQLEIGHVLFMDVVGFSKLLVDEQARCSKRLNEVVRNAQPFKSAEIADKLIRLPTGDGMALVFFDSPESPVRCAVEIAKALREADFGLRMGIHSGPLNKITDVNDRSNLAGAGINIAQRIMDCGDAGHILLSRRVAEDLEQHSRWRPSLHDLGECEVKHGVRVHVVNLCSDEFGNSALPERIALARKSAAVVREGEKRLDSRPARRRRQAILWTVLVCALLGMAISFRFFSQRRAALTHHVAAAIESLAVKPLDNFSGDATKNYFADGMTEELTTKLSEIGALKTVISRSSMMKYKGSSKSPSEIAREVNVGAIVAGSVMLSGSEAKITVELIDAATEAVLLRREYPRQVANIVQLQNEVALAIANAISLKLTPNEKARLASGRIVIPEAYESYLQGKSLISDTDSAKNIDGGIALLEKAVFLDPKFAEAYAALADSYHTKAYFFSAGDAELDRQAEKALAQALELDPDLPAANLVRAGLFWRPSSGFPHEETILGIRRALAIAPNFGDAHFFLGVVYFHVGLIEESRQEFIRARQLLPDDPGGKAHLGLIALFQGRYAEAAAALQANLPGIPRSFGEYNIACAFLYSGDVNAAQMRIENIKEKFEDEGGLLIATRALLLAVAGDKKAAHEKIEEALKAGEGFGHFHHTTYAVASAYSIMNEPDDAMKWLTYTAENGYPNLAWFQRDPNLETLRKDPRFAELVQKMTPRFERLKVLAHGSASAQP